MIYEAHIPGFTCIPPIRIPIYAYLVSVQLSSIQACTVCKILYVQRADVPRTIVLGHLLQNVIHRSYDMYDNGVHCTLYASLYYVQYILRQSHVGVRTPTTRVQYLCYLHNAVLQHFVDSTPTTVLCQKSFSYAILYRDGTRYMYDIHVPGTVRCMLQQFLT